MRASVKFWTVSVAGRRLHEQEEYVSEKYYKNSDFHKASSSWNFY